MKNLKKIGALVLALMLVLSLMSVAFADQTLTNGEVGGYTSPDVQNVNDKVIKIRKDIVAYNPDEAYVYGPAITYDYTVTAGTAGVSITDATTDHTSGVSSVTTTIAGPLPGLAVNGTTGTTGSIAWTNADILDASAAGTANSKFLTLDFTGVVFTQPGVYRYTITETEHTDAEYTAAGVDETTGSHVRYLDVYVMRSDTYSDGTHNTDWRVYGYVCVYNDSTAIVDGDTNNAVKTNGFVAGTTNGSTALEADEYYTYNLTVTKDLVGDNTMINHKFPFAVAFDTSAGVTGTFQLIAETDGTYSTLTTAPVAAGAETVNEPDDTATGFVGTTAALNKVGSAVALASFANAGSPTIADGNTTEGTTAGYIKYIGIPNLAIASVTETNDLIGTTYSATVKEDLTTDDGTALASVTMTSTTGTMSTDGYYASIDNTETATRKAATSGYTDDALVKNADIQFTNKLALISPTGYVVRIAPYALILMFGIGLIVILAVRRRKEQEEA